MELNSKTWDSLEATCQVENSLFYTAISKQKWKLLKTTKVLDSVPFLDDTDLFCSEDNIRTLFKTANHKLKQINDSFFANKLSINVEKTKYIIFPKLTDHHDNVTLKLPSLQLSLNKIMEI